MADPFKSKLASIVNDANKAKNPRTKLLEALGQEYSQANEKQREMMHEIIFPLIEDKSLNKATLQSIISNSKHPLHLLFIEKSPFLQDDDMSKIVSSKDHDSLMALCKRKNLSANTIQALAEQGGKVAVMEMISNPTLLIPPEIAAQWLIENREDYDFLNIAMARMRGGDPVFGQILKGLTNHLPAFPDGLNLAMKYEFIKDRGWPEHVFINAIMGDENNNYELLGIYAQVPPQKLKIIMKEFSDGLYLIYRKAGFPNDLFQFFKKAWDMGQAQTGPKDEHERTVYGFEKTKEILDEMIRYDDGQEVMQNYNIKGPTDLFKAFNDHCNSPMMAYLKTKNSDISSNKDEK